MKTKTASGYRQPMTTDRYVRRGGPLSQIYPGNLSSLNQAMKDCVSASRFLPDITFRLMAVQDGESQLIRLFKAGRDITTADDLIDEDEED